MATLRKVLNEKQYAGNPHVRFDEGEVASSATPRRGSLLYRTRKMMSIAALCVVLAPQSWAAAHRYAMPVYSMGNYHPSDPTNSIFVIKTSRLAFKGIDLDELKAKVDDGYEVFAHMCGGAISAPRQAIVPCYNLQVYPQSGPIEKIVGDFAVDNRSITSGMRSAVCVEFTNGVAGVYVRGLHEAYVNDSSQKESYKFITLAADGSVSFSGTSWNLATTWTQGSAYGAVAVQCAKFVPSSASTLAFAGATLDDIKDYEFTGIFGGATEQHGLPCRGYNKMVADDSIRVEMQALSGNVCKCVVVEFTNGAGGVHARTLTARTASGEALGYGFVQEDGTAYNGAEVAVATSWASGTGLGVYGLTATAPVYDMEADEYVPRDGSILVWRGITLDAVTNHWLGCRFLSGSMTDSEGRGCNRRIEYTNGLATRMRVEFQHRAGNNVKCVAVDFTNGVDGVYATAVAGRYRSTTYASVGYKFLYDDGTYNGGAFAPGASATDGIATSATASGYGIYRMFALPCVTLDRDEDWSAFGQSDFGNTVVDLDGHALTVGGLSFDQSHAAQIVNTKADTTSELRFYVFDGGVFTNDCVFVGGVLTYILTGGSLGGENIKVVKDGGGTFVPVIQNNLYAGGTEVAAGTMLAAFDGAVHATGKSGSEIHIDAGATFDTGVGLNFTDYDFVLDGGTVRSGSENLSSEKFKNMSLTADSTFEVPYSYGFVGPNHVATSLDLGGYTLTVKINSGKTLQFDNTTIVNGTLDIVSGGTLQTYHTASAARTVDLRANCALKMETALSVRNYEAVWNKVRYNSGTAALDVYGVFKPANTVGAYYGCTMQNGSAIDFSGWPSSIGWPMQSHSTAGDATLKFAANSTVTVKLAGRADLGQLVHGGTYLLKWGSEFGTATPENVTFKLEDAMIEAKYRIVQDETGLKLYKVGGFMLVVR